MSKQSEFIESLEEALTPEQVVQLLGLADEGDTDESEKGSVPSVATDAGKDSQEELEAGKKGMSEEELDGLNSENTVILAKDEKHTISFDVLRDQRAIAKAAREGQESAERDAQTERDKRLAAEAELSALRAEAQDRKDAGLTATVADKNLEFAQAALDAGVDTSVFGDWSEESIAKGVGLIAERLAESKTQVLRDELQELKKLIEPMQSRHVESAETAHFDKILAVHPDIDSITESRELADWIASQPSFAQAGYKAVLANGTAVEVIEAIDAFKAATGVTQTKATDLRSAAKSLIANTKVEPPISLTDVPGARSGPATTDEALSAMDGVGLINAMDDWPQDRIERFLNGL